jgi:hypothetical protein
LRKVVAAAGTARASGRPGHTSTMIEGHLGSDTVEPVVHSWGEQLDYCWLMAGISASGRDELAGVAVPTLASIRATPFRTEIEAEWANMLAHQLPDLPAFDGFWNALSDLFGWLDSSVAVPALNSATDSTVDPAWSAPRTMVSWRTGAPIELVRFGGANRLKVVIDYRAEQGRQGRRLVEPYALRRSRDGSLLLFVVNDRGQLRSYRADRIAGVSVTRQPFTPRFRVEF